MTQRAKQFISGLLETDKAFVHVDVPVIREALAEAFRTGYGAGWQDALAGSVVFRDDASAERFLTPKKETRG